MYIQWNFKNYGMGRRLLDSSYDLKKSTRQLCIVYRPISLYKLIYRLVVKPFAIKKTNTNEIVKMSSSYSKILWISLYTLNSLSYSYWKKRKIFQLTNFQSHTGCLTKHDSWWIALNVFFHNLLSCLIQKKITKNIIWQSYYCKNLILN